MSTAGSTKSRNRSQEQAATLPQNLFWNALGQCFDLSRYDPIQPERSRLATQGRKAVVQLSPRSNSTELDALERGADGFPVGTEPDGAAEIGDATSETRCIYTRHDYQKTFTESSRTKVAGPLGRRSFSMSQTFSETVRTSRQKTLMSTFNERQHVLFAARLKTVPSPPTGGAVHLVLDLDAGFSDAVAKLPVDGDWPQRYAQFIDTWGTHFAESIEIGGRAYLNSIFYEQEYEKMVEKDVKVSVAASGVFRGVQGSGSGTYEERTVQGFQECTSRRKTQFEIVGGDLVEDLNQWATTIRANPGVVNTSLRPLYDLLHEGHYPHDPDIVLKRTLLMLAIQEHLDEPATPVDSHPALLLYKNKYFDGLRSVAYDAATPGGRVSGLKDLEITSVLAPRGRWQLFTDSPREIFEVSSLQGVPQSLFPHSDSWGGSDDVNDEMTEARYVGPDANHGDSVIYLFPEKGLEGNGSEELPRRITEDLDYGADSTPQSALAVKGQWMLYRNGDSVGRLLEPTGGDTDGQPGQYRQLSPNMSSFVRLKRLSPFAPWRPAGAPSVKASDMAHLMSETAYAKGRWSGKTWTHVRYAVSFLTPSGESFLGPWSAWFPFATDNVIMPRLYDLPVDAVGPDAEHPVSTPTSVRRIYRQFGAGVQGGEATRHDRPEHVMDVEDATSNRTLGYDVRP